MCMHVLAQGPGCVACVCACTGRWSCRCTRVWAHMRLWRACMCPCMRRCGCMCTHLCILSWHFLSPCMCARTRLALLRVTCAPELCASLHTMLSGWQPLLQGGVLHPRSGARICGGREILACGIQRTLCPLNSQCLPGCPVQSPAGRACGVGRAERMGMGGGGPLYLSAHAQQHA